MLIYGFFLHYVLCKYINNTNDINILLEQVTYLMNVDMLEGMRGYRHL